jgi:SET domain-containing protein
MPHEHVYVRLGPSAIHGVGVFAIRDIPRGAPVFGVDDAPVSRVPAASVRRLRGESRQLYEDFGVVHGNEYLCPPSFNLLTVSWYLNHSETPNTRCDKDLRFVATRRIRKGEELTADYGAYSDDSLRWLRDGISRKTKAAGN